MPTEILRPAGAGHQTSYTPNGAASNWDCVNDASPDDDTTYISTTAGGGATLDGYTLTATALTTETINSIDTWSRARVAAGAGAGDNVNQALYLAFNYTYGGQQTLTTSYVDRERAAMARPGGGSWAVSDLATLEQVIALEESGTSTARCTQAWVEVNYTASGGATGPAWYGRTGWW